MIKKERFVKTTTERRKSKKSIIIIYERPINKLKSSQRTKRPIASNTEQKDAIQQHNRFGSLSDSSDDLELEEAPDHLRTSSNRSRPSEHLCESSSNSKSKSLITYP